jgi:hypothetical protein
MSEPVTEPLPPPRTLERLPRRKESPWLMIVGIAFLVLMVGAGLWMFLAKPSADRPYDIKYPGVTWMYGDDSSLKEGKRYLQAAVRFDLEVLSADEFDRFLDTLVSKTDKTYVFYHIRGFNSRGQHIIDGVVGPDSRSTFYGPDYNEQ